MDFDLEEPVRGCPARISPMKNSQLGPNLSWGQGLQCPSEGATTRSSRPTLHLGPARSFFFEESSDPGLS
jgi:hypothetical protein